jgi:phenylpropionate dioxygenase-like ring-hydroxylating dioxygenase large terminal subunit
MTDERQRITQFWHPVAAVGDVQQAPVGVTLVGRRLVVFAASDGEVVVLDDLCVHRGAPLSLGFVADDCIVCPYHGWRYDAKGKCVSIPALPVDAHIPTAARATRHRSEVRYGLVWVALEEPVAPIPAFPMNVDSDPSYRGGYWASMGWNTSAGRAIENEMDLAHFPFVHPFLLADPDAPSVLDYEVDVSPDGVLVRAPRARYLEPGQTLPPGHTDYIHVFPYTHHLKIVESGFDTEHITVISGFHCPSTAASTRIWWFIHRNFVPDFSEDEEREMFMKVLEQDRIITEAVRPEAIPASIRDELHVRLPDAPSLAFRRWLEGIDLDCLAAG